MTNSSHDVLASEPGSDRLVGEARNQELRHS